MTQQYMLSEIHTSVLSAKYYNAARLGDDLVLPWNHI